MVLKKLTELALGELMNELEKAGIETKNVGEREAVLRLTTYLIDLGEDPTSYEYILEDEEKKEETQEPSSEKQVLKRQGLLAKIVKLENSYFTQESRTF